MPTGDLASSALEWKENTQPFGYIFILIHSLVVNLNRGQFIIPLSRKSSQRERDRARVFLFLFPLQSRHQRTAGLAINIVVHENAGLSHEISMVVRHDKIERRRRFFNSIDLL